MKSTVSAPGVAEPESDKTLAPQDGHKQSKHPVDQALTEFLYGLYGIQKSFTVVMPHLSNWISDESKRIEERYRAYQIESSNPNERRYHFSGSSSQTIADWMSFRRDSEDSKGVDHLAVLAQSLFTQIFCQFDAFMGALLKALYNSKPQLYDALERQISISGLRSFDTIKAVTEHLLEAEIDAFRRSSYVDQFQSLQNRFNIELRDFPEWGEFVELGQRRNLLIHNGGVVNEQYRAVCKREKNTEAATIAIGTRLDINGEYLARALLIMRKVAFMLSHTLWRKVLPDQITEAHNACHNVIYDFLQKKMWGTAAELGEFSLKPINCKNLTEQYRRMRVINTAIGFKFSNRAPDCSRILNAEDWSSTYRDFRLAVSVLNDQRKDVWEQMRQIGKKGEIIEAWSYRDWPLFHALRNDPDFHNVFEEIFEEPFIFKDLDLPNRTLTTSATPVVECQPSSGTTQPPRKKAVTSRRKTMNPASIPGPTTEAPTKAKSTRK